MFALKCVFIWMGCLLGFDLVSCPKLPLTVTAKPGEDVPLQCRGPTDASFRRIEWSRTDLKPEDYVFFFRENRSYEHYQHPSFRGRVELRDPEMKNGNFSVILKNVTVDDTGTYECDVITNKTDAPERISNTTLAVVSGSTAGGNQDGDLGLTVGLSFAGVLIVVGTCVFVYSLIIRKRKQRVGNHQYQPPPETGHQGV